MEAPTILDWLAVVGVSGAFASVVSAVFNYFINKKQYYRQGLRQLFENRIRAYVTIISSLNRLLEAVSELNLAGDKEKTERMQIVDKLMTSISVLITDNSHLLNFGVQNHWNFILPWWSQHKENGKNLIKLKNKISLLKDGLESEYQGSILDKYDKVSWDISYLKVENQEYHKYYRTSSESETK